MATLRQRESGWWQAIVRRKGHRDVSKTFRTKTEAEKWAKGIEADINRGVHVSRHEAERTTLKEALTRYQSEVTPKKRGANQEMYRIRALLKHELASKMLASVRGAEVAKYRDEELARGLAPSSVTKSLALLSHLFETAKKEWGIEVDNPVTKISKPKVNNSRQRRLLREEETYLVQALDEPGHSVRSKDGDRRNEWTPRIVRFAIETAMRQGEILALDWKHVDLQKRTAHLPDTKNGTARTVPLSTAATSVMNGEGPISRIRKGRVFPTSSSALKQSFMRAVARAKRKYLADYKNAGQQPQPGFLEDLTFHDLRHEATSRLAEKLQLHELMRVTGHKDMRMLARYYHPRAEDLAQKLG